MGKNPFGLFVTHNDTVYIAAREKGHVMVWHEKNSDSVHTFITDLPEVSGVFVTDPGQIYVARYDHRVLDLMTSAKLAENSILSFDGLCLSIFVDRDFTPGTQKIITRFVKRVGHRRRYWLHRR